VSRRKAREAQDLLLAEFLKIHFKISSPPKKKAQPGAEAASAAACTTGAFMGFHGQCRIKKKLDSSWVQI
jgi:hypothetical protein